MKRLKRYIKAAFCIAAISPVFNLAAQNSTCKVLMAEISGTYDGDCKNGLANGTGTATGTDRYEGQFSKGLPNGKGTYKWTGGPVYSGEWSKGLRNGKGEMVYPTSRGDSTVTGYWRDGNYIGKENVPSFSVTRKDDLLSYNFRRVGEGNQVVIKFMMKGQRNPNVRGLTLAFTSGVRFISGSYEGVQAVRYPLDLKINYSTNNPASRSTFDVVFECIINEPGRWEITLNN